MVTVTARQSIQVATALLWLPLVMAGGSLVLAKAVAAPVFIAMLGMICLTASLVFLWAGVLHLVRRPLRLADFFWLGLFGAGAMLYTHLAHLLNR